MITFKKLREACWSGYKAVGLKKKNGKMVPNCVPEEDAPANSAGGGNIAGIGVGPDGEPGVKPKAANCYKKKNRDEFKKRITNFLTKFKMNENVSASEIATQASNDSQLYARQLEPIVKNLARKKVKGIYNKDLAVKLFRYAVDNKVKEIAKSKNMNSRTIPGKVRDDAAARMLSQFDTEINDYVEYLKGKKK